MAEDNLLDTSNEINEIIQEYNDKFSRLLVNEKELLNFEIDTNETDPIDDLRYNIYNYPGCNWFTKWQIRRHYESSKMVLTIMDLLNHIKEINNWIITYKMNIKPEEKYFIPFLFKYYTITKKDTTKKPEPFFYEKLTSMMGTIRYLLVKLLHVFHIDFGRLYINKGFSTIGYYNQFIYMANYLINYLNEISSTLKNDSKTDKWMFYSNSSVILLNLIILLKELKSIYGDFELSSRIDFKTMMEVSERLHTLKEDTNSSGSCIYGDTEMARPYYHIGIVDRNEYMIYAVDNWVWTSHLLMGAMYYPKNKEAVNQVFLADYQELFMKKFSYTISDLYNSYINFSKGVLSYEVLIKNITSIFQEGV